MYDIFDKTLFVEELASALKDMMDIALKDVMSYDSNMNFEREGGCEAICKKPHGVVEGILHPFMQ